MGSFSETQIDPKIIYERVRLGSCGRASLPPPQEKTPSFTLGVKLLCSLLKVQYLTAFLFVSETLHDCQTRPGVYKHAADANQ